MVLGFSFGVGSGGWALMSGKKWVFGFYVLPMASCSGLLESSVFLFESEPLYDFVTCRSAGASCCYALSGFKDLILNPRKHDVDAQDMGNFRQRDGQRMGPEPSTLTALGSETIPGTKGQHRHEYT